MKKILGILVLGLILFATSADAIFKTKRTKFKTGQVYEGSIVYQGGVKINLPEGQWTMIGRWGWSVSAVRADGVIMGSRLDFLTQDPKWAPPASERPPLVFGQILSEGGGSFSFNYLS